MKRADGGMQGISVGLAKTIYIRCVYGCFGSEITKYTVIYGVDIRFWPTLNKRCQVRAAGPCGMQAWVKQFRQL